jgi:hypothetical protein
MVNEIASTLPNLTTCSYVSYISLPIPFYQGHDVAKKTQIEKYKQNINVATNNKHLEP